MNASATTSATEKRRSVLRSVLRSPQGLAGTILIAAIIILGLLAPLIAPYDPLDQIPEANLLGPTGDHWFGTDQVNRDILSRVLYGIRISLLCAVAGVAIGAVIGTLLGLLSVTSRIADTISQRLFDVILAFPSLILAIALAAILDTGTNTVIVVIAAVDVPVFGRLVRSSGLRTRELPFTEAAEVAGASQWWILKRHILPHAAEPLITQIALSLSTAVFIESAMSFIGIGVRPPEPSLGSIISDSVPLLNVNPAFAIAPLLVVVVLVLSFLLLSQAIGKARRS